MMTGTWAKSIAGAMALAVLAGPASAGSLKDEAAPSGRMLEWSANFAVTSDYIYRGMSQTNKNPAVQAGLDLTYGILYAGIWSSTVDFGPHTATAEVDLVAGIKPTLGPVSFDFGVIYYTYPGAHDSAAELNMLEVKAGASVAPWKGGTVGVTGFWSPDYTGETGDVWTVEGSFAQELPKIRDIGLTFSALVGYQSGDDAAYEGAFFTDHYTYWNAGLTLGFHERFSLDLRYWDTDLDFCQNDRLFHCGARFVATAKATF
ncbi:MAG TPA: TorF family putative porin [Hyphomicrobiaceae bacterium]|nr:TorF family putative porin [Hyphomicrobiaceae bacterium]